MAMNTIIPVNRYWYCVSKYAGAGQRRYGHHHDPDQAAGHRTLAARNGGSTDQNSGDCAIVEALPISIVPAP